MNTVFAPGCALMLYKPDLAEKVHKWLDSMIGKTEILDICCKHDPGFSNKTRVINICPGCDKRFKNDYEHTTTISLWEVLAKMDHLKLPDYKGLQMSILDACPTRSQTQIHDAIRVLLKKMNIELIEPNKTRTKSTCCGDSFFGIIPLEDVKQQMRKRAEEMPVDDVVVYCVSCVKSMFIGGRQPHYLVDLLLEEETLPQTLDPVEWHKELDVYIEAH